MKKILFILVVFFTVLDHNSFAQKAHFATADPPKEDPWSVVLAMAQDPQGYLWFATKEGVYKYDGHQYTSYQHEPSNPNSLSLNWVESIFADKSGAIWIGTFGGGLDRFDPSTNIFTHYRHQPGNARSLANDKVAAIIQDHDGAIWLGTLGGLDKLDPQTGIFKHFIHNDKDLTSLSNNIVRVVYEDRQGTIWAGTGSPFIQDDPARGGGLNKLDEKTGKFTRYMHDANNPHSLINNIVRVIFEDSRGTFWVGTAGDGLHTMNREKGTFERHLYDPAHPEKLSRPPIKTTLVYGDDHIVFITEDNSGKIWIGTFQGGINVYDPHTQKTVWYGKGPNSTEKLVQDEFWCAYKSRDGIIWIAPWQGTVLYKISPYQSKLPYHYLGKNAFHFTPAANKAMWIASDAGLICQDSSNNRQMFYYKTGLHGTEKGNDNDLWIPGGSHGLLQFNPVNKVLTLYKHQAGNTTSLISDTVITVKKGAPGKVWAGTALNGLDEMDMNTGVFRHFQYDAKDTTSLSNNAVFAIERDNNNTIWVGTGLGVNKLNEKIGHFKRYLNKVRVFEMTNSNDGNLWVATDNGLYGYNRDADNFSLVGTDRAEVFGVVEDHEKDLWLEKYKGLTKINLQNNETTVYGKNQGVNGALLKADYVMPDGEVLIGDTAGYFAFYPDKLLHSTPAPSVDISGFLLADVPVAPSAQGLLTKPIFSTTVIRLNHNQATFSFTFTNIDFVSEGADIRNFYMLENYDSKWRKGSSDQIANYFNVPPGDYIFKIKSVNNNGLVTEKHIAVIISPPWWQTWWAYIIFAVLFAGSIWGFIHYRSLSLLKEKRVLERKVHARTEEVLQQKEEIEAQRDSLEKAFGDLKTTQTQLIQSEKMASLGELTAGIAHEIQNPLNFVNNFSEVNRELLEELKAESKKQKAERDGQLEIELINDIIQNEEKINHHGKRADSIVKGMLEHSRSGSGQKEPTDINTMADEFLRLSYHGLRSKDKSFNAELVTRFDPDLPKINVVQQDIGRVLLNLLNNAFYAVNQKAKTAGGDYKPTVEVETAPQPPPAGGGAKSVLIIVRDNGVGIPDAIKDKIMQPFFTTKPTGEGTGLGLSLAYDMVVKGHGGKIEVDTESGVYTKFKITLPIS